MRGGSPRPAEALRSADDPTVQLQWEEVFDRRWRRHRDQLVTMAGTAAGILALITGSWGLVPLVAASVGGPAALRWWQHRLPQRAP